jgi:hypothetical protein
MGKLTVQNNPASLLVELLLRPRTPNPLVLLVLDKSLQNNDISSTKKLRRRKKDHATVQVQL